MTNPKHTDTSRIADLRFQVSEKMPINHSDLSCLFDRIEALEAKNERLREALLDVLVYAPDYMHGMPKKHYEKIALGEKQ